MNCHTHSRDALGYFPFQGVRQIYASVSGLQIFFVLCLDLSQMPLQGLGQVHSRPREFMFPSCVSHGGG